MVSSEQKTRNLLLGSILFALLVLSVSCNGSAFDTDDEIETESQGDRHRTESQKLQKRKFQYYWQRPGKSHLRPSPAAVRTKTQPATPPPANPDAAKRRKEFEQKWAAKKSNLQDNGASKSRIRSERAKLKFKILAGTSPPTP